MFAPEIYSKRRMKLRDLVKSGIAIFPGNLDQPYNYPGNTYHFRQDSTFSYFFGLNGPNLFAIIDFDEQKEILFGDNIGMEDIIWMGYLPKIEERAAEVGVKDTMPLESVVEYVKKALNLGRKIHFLPPYQGDTLLNLSALLNIPTPELKNRSSLELINAVIELRSVKGSEEISEIEKMIDVAYDMHTTAMRMARPGVNEREIAAAMEGIALSHGNGISFPIILSMNGEILHNHSHTQVLEKGRLMVADAGSESDLLYASDITRTMPVGGKFSDKQKDVFEILLAANVNTLKNTSPSLLYKEIHLQSAKIIAQGLKDLGLMTGNIDDAVSAGAHALFFPHGLGHMMGMDVHDLEGLGEDYVGYNDMVKRSEQFGLAYLRFGRKPQPGYVLTNEPGIYFIPALIDMWHTEKKFTEFIKYEKLESYKGFGGIRIEDDILVTENGCRLLGKPIPKTVKEIEDVMSS